MIGSIQTAAPKQSHARRAVAFYFLAYTGLGASMAIVGPTLPALGHNTSTALAALSVILVTRSVGHLSGSLLGGWFYDHYRGHPVMAGALVVGAIAIAAVPGIVNVWLLAAVFFFVGVAVNVLDVGGNTLLIWFFGSKSGPYINALHFSFGIGALIAPLVVVQIVQWTGTIDWAYRLLGLWILLPVVFLLRLRSPRNLKSEPGGGDASQNKKNIVLMGLFALLFLFCLGSEMSFGDWIYSYGVETGMENEVSAGVLTSAFWAFLTFGRLLGIPVAARVRPRVILLVDLVGMVGCLTVLSLWGGSQVVLWGGTILLGVVMASIIATIFSWAERQLTISGRVTSIFFVGMSIGPMIFAWLSGQALGRYGPGALMVVPLISAVLGLMTMMLILAMGRKQG